MTHDGYRPGDYYVICDECGLQYRASQTRKRWDGLRVCNKDWEPRHPQDFVRGRTDRYRVHDAKPEQFLISTAGWDDGEVLAWDDGSPLAWDSPRIITADDL